MNESLLSRSAVLADEYNPVVLNVQASQLGQRQFRHIESQRGHILSAVVGPDQKLVAVLLELRKLREHSAGVTERRGEREVLAESGAERSLV